MTPADAARVAGGQHHASRLDRHVGTGADGQADIGAGQCRSIVDAIPDHRHAGATLLELAHCLVLVLREHLGEHLADAEITPDGVGDLFGVTGDHRHLDTHSLEVGHGLAGLRADLVLQRQCPDDLVVLHQVEHRRAAPLPAIDRLLQVVGNRERSLTQQRRAADGVGHAVDGCLDATARQRPERSRRGNVASLSGGVDDRSRQWVLTV